MSHISVGKILFGPVHLRKDFDDFGLAPSHSKIVDPFLGRQ